MLGITLDTCIINSKGRVLSMNKLEQWHDEEKIQLYITDIMEEESDLISSQWQKQEKYVFQLLKPDKIEYPMLFKMFKNILFSTVRILDNNQKRDVNHLCVHVKYGNKFFITTDGNFIRCKGDLKKTGISVLTPDECVKLLVEKYGWQ